MNNTNKKITIELSENNLVFLFAFLSASSNNPMYELEASTFMDGIIKELLPEFTKLAKQGRE